MLALRRTRTMHRRPLNMDDSTTTRFKFLLVEDDPAMIELESLLLEEAGHTVVALHSSDDALSKIKENCYLIHWVFIKLTHLDIFFLRL